MNAKTIAEWLDYAKTQVESLDAELIAMRFLAPAAKDRSWLAAHGDSEIYESSRDFANKVLEKRAAGMPMAYLLGEKEFYGRKFVVTPDVLVPRPETEALIDLVKELELPKRPRILELGTGSGCIAVTLALEIQNAEVVATDISQDALMIAQRNSNMFEAEARISKSDLMDSLSFDDDAEGKFDVLVANLPYVNPAWEGLDLRALEYEPRQALFALTENGLSIYRRMFKELAERIDEPGFKYIVLEADPCQHDDLAKIAQEYGWKLTKHKDYGLVFEPKA